MRIRYFAMLHLPLCVEPGRVSAYFYDEYQASQIDSGRTNNLDRRARIGALTRPQQLAANEHLDRRAPGHRSYASPLDDRDERIVDERPYLAEPVQLRSLPCCGRGRSTACGCRPSSRRGRARSGRSTSARPNGALAPHADDAEKTQG